MVVRGAGAALVVPGGLDRVLHALADPTRRDIVATVLQREQSVSALAARYPMSFAAVQKHVAVLERADMVHKRRHGREQLVSGDIAAMRTVNQLLNQYESVWRSRVDQMDAILAHDETEKRSTTKEKKR